MTTRAMTHGTDTCRRRKGARSRRASTRTVAAAVDTTQGVTPRTKSGPMTTQVAAATRRRTGSWPPAGASRTKEPRSSRLCTTHITSSVPATAATPGRKAIAT